ncbi:hypothetical protein KIH74_27205 [Kineosporia sp. J2-2]|uniref:Uncharacterized protein n=1 Tax=Kineosporia corallincola TaxID=2835133 RepID=A0ABS5TNJ2_9ACTN|nr:hypothetical protein [Kineosporia corallincola]MBT0772662.1 hypothetical protein [Kineosporia corallincola]
MSVKRISLALAAAVLGAGAFTAATLPAQASPASTTFSAIPAKATDSYGFAKDGLEFGYLTKVTLKNDKLRITLDQAEFYDGKAAKLLNGGITPPDDYRIAHDDTQDPFTYTVSTKASLIGVNELLGHPDDLKRTTITRTQLVKNFAELENKHVAVWLRHTDTESNGGQVTALAEQYIP